MRPTDERRLVSIGSPVRAEFITARSSPYPVLGSTGPIEILAVGGSQGARVMGRTLPAAFAGLPEELRRRIHVVQQCREEDLDAARQVYRQAGIEATLAPFIENIADRLAAAHLVIARAGASTVAELTVVGRPAILIPYPHATDDHQSANARAVASAGGAWMVAEDTLSAEDLTRRIEQALADPSGLATAAARARAMGHPDAVERLVDAARALIAGDDPRKVAA
jgi:UDP-N-acetylglucosamine--N-acetylmuramyl-(pentapeptide) pyrophosphoryl-undecaprenol N-acetylglucosamine transferase